MTETQKKVRQNLDRVVTSFQPYLDLEVQDFEKEECPEKCRRCAFVTDKERCGSPWTCAEEEQNQICKCYEGIWYYYTGLPEPELQKLIDAGRDVPFLRVYDWESFWDSKKVTDKEEAPQGPTEGTTAPLREYYQRKAAEKVNEEAAEE